MRRLKLSTFVTILLSLSLFAQEKEESTEFIPSGKPFAKIYSNVNLTTQDGETNYAFDITRAYLGYGYKFSQNFSGKINIDVGSPDVFIGDSLEGSTSLDLTAYLKIAALSYTNNNVTVNFGLIGMKQFKVQEKNWGHRYLYKSFQDAYKFGPSADLGLTVDYKIIDMLSTDISITNGEGYKKLQGDDVFKYGIGVTLKPIDGLTVRGYYDMMGDDIVQSTLATFVGYQADKLSVGAEYNMQSNNKMNDGRDFSGISIYSSYQATKKLEVYVRYDNLSSVTVSGETDAWNIEKDGQAILVGVEVSPVKGVKITPNYQGWFSAKDDTEALTGLYINAELNF